MTNFILIEGRGRANAVLALAATKLAGHDEAVVRTVNNGYEVPEDAQEFYDRLVAGEELEAPEGEEGSEKENDEPSDTGDAEEEESTDITVELVDPAKNASKAVWEAFAHEHHGYDVSEGLTRDQIIERYGSSE